ncbi:hypothetical protein SpCBS45565_g08036 [Spizellomyces sp. 'palustris']|nr:hypothetical protein SpCBS45565_g08036 [Spizellomyces sp. 'palustris']
MQYRFQLWMWAQVGRPARIARRLRKLFARSKPAPARAVIQGTPVVGNWVVYSNPDGPSAGVTVLIDNIDRTNPTGAVTDDSLIYLVEDEHTMDRKTMCKREFTGLVPGPQWVDRVWNNL